MPTLVQSTIRALLIMENEVRVGHGDHTHTNCMLALLAGHGDLLKSMSRAPLIMENEVRVGHGDHTLTYFILAVNGGGGRG